MGPTSRYCTASPLGIISSDMAFGDGKSRPLPGVTGALAQGGKPTGEKDPIKPVACSSICMMFISTLAMGNKGKGRVKSLQAHTLNPTPIWQGRSEGGWGVERVQGKCFLENACGGRYIPRP